MACGEKKNGGNGELGDIIVLYGENRSVGNVRGRRMVATTTPTIRGMDTPETHRGRCVAGGGLEGPGWAVVVQDVWCVRQTARVASHPPPCGSPGWGVTITKHLSGAVRAFIPHSFRRRPQDVVNNGKLVVVVAPRHEMIVFHPASNVRNYGLFRITKKQNHFDGGDRRASGTILEGCVLETNSV